MYRCIFLSKPDQDVTTIGCMSVGSHDAHSEVGCNFKELPWC
jgi:hypothetical protein